MPAFSERLRSRTVRYGSALALTAGLVWGGVQTEQIISRQIARADANTKVEALYDAPADFKILMEVEKGRNDYETVSRVMSNLAKLHVGYDKEAGARSVNEVLTGGKWNCVSASRLAVLALRLNGIESYITDLPLYNHAVVAVFPKTKDGIPAHLLYDAGFFLVDAAPVGTDGTTVGINVGEKPEETRILRNGYKEFSLHLVSKAANMTGEDAVSLLEFALKIDPENRSAMYNLALERMKTHRFEEAKQLARRKVDLSPNGIAKIKALEDYVNLIRNIIEMKRELLEDSDAEHEEWRAASEEMDEIIKSEFKSGNRG